MTNEEYRTRIIMKLNTLIGVLQVAIARIEKSMSSPNVNKEQLGKIRNNLRKTVELCSKSKRTLEDGATPSEKEFGQLFTDYNITEGESLRQGSSAPSGARAYTELSNIDEYRKFQAQPPITAEEVAEVDMEDLIDKLEGA